MNKQDQVRNFDFERFFKLILKNYWLFITMLILSIGVAYFYLRVSPKTYDISATILINNDENGSGNKDGDGYINKNLFESMQNMENELLVLQSYPLIEKTIQNLDLTISYYEYDKFHFNEIYNDSPFNVRLFTDYPQLVNAMITLNFREDGRINLEVTQEDATLFNFDSKQEVLKQQIVDIEAVGELGKAIQTDYFKFIVTLKKQVPKHLMTKNVYAFKILPNEYVAKYYHKELNIDLVEKGSTVVSIAMKSQAPVKDIDVINELIQVYAAENLKKKNQIAQKTIHYIEGQLGQITQSLNNTEDSLQKFLSKNQLFNIENRANSYSNQLMELENQLAELKSTDRYYAYAKEYLSENQTGKKMVAPTSMGIEDPLLNKLIMDLSEAQSQRSMLTQNNQERSPLVDRLNVQIENIRREVVENIESGQRSNDLSIEAMQQRIREIENKISTIPIKQKQLGGIERSYNLNDGIYNYLLKKHAEAKITMASNMPNSEILETASSKGIMTPKSNIIYAIALFAGICVPIGILLLIYLYSTTKIETPEDLENITDAPLLGTIHHHGKKNEKNIFHKSPNSNISEGYRILRSNLNYALKDKKTKTILISSSISGEGKSFNAVNIASSYAALGEKTALVNFDLRKSTVLLTHQNQNVGISTFLSGESNPDQICVNGEMKNLYYVHAGSSVNNPIEMMTKEKLDQLFTYLKSNFDCIIIDTTPLVQVADAYEIMSYIDLCLIVARHKYTSKRTLRFILKGLIRKDILNVALILNDNRMYTEAYGYGYNS